MYLLLMLTHYACEAAFATYVEAARRFGKSPSDPTSHHHHQTSAKQEGGSRNPPPAYLGRGGKIGGSEMARGGGGDDDEHDDDEHRWMTVQANTTAEKACLNAKIKLGEILASCSTGSTDIEGDHYAQLVTLLTTLQYIQQH